MKKLVIYMTILVLVSFISACKDENSNATKTELLTGKTWVIKSKKITPSVTMSGMTISDIMILDTPEVQLYSFKHNADGSVIEYNQLNENIFQSNWTFNADETQITYNPGIVFNYPVVGDMRLETMEVISIAEDELITKIPYNFGGTNYEVTFTYKSK